MGSQRRLNLTNTGVAIEILPRNLDRKGYSLIADGGNAGNIFIGFDDPNVTATSDHAGYQLAANGQLAESPPAVFTGAIYAIVSAATQVLIVREDTSLDTSKVDVE